MKRTRLKIAMALVASVAMLFFATSTVNAQPEIHLFFGTPTPVPGLPPVYPGMNSNPVTPPINPALTPTLYLPVWARVLNGANTAGTQINALQFQLVGRSGGGAPAAGAVVLDAASSLLDPIDGYTMVMNDTTVAANNQGESILRPTGFNGLPGGSRMNSLNPTVPFDVPGENAYYLGYIAIHPTATQGFLDIYFGTPGGSQRIAVQAGAQARLGLGWNGSTNAPNIEGLTPTGVIPGAAPNRISTLPDLTINFIPEPGTMGLLAIGLLGLLRRRR